MPKKKQPAKTKPVKKIKIQREALEYQQIEANCEDDGISPAEEVGELLIKGFSATVLPRNQIALLKPLAERFDVGLDDLAEAESLIDERGEVSDLHEFNDHMEGARILIAIVYFGRNLLLKEEKWSKFEEGCRRDRLDNLGEAMVKAWHAFVKDEGRIPKAFELWDWIPQGGHITEKDSDNTIYWKRSNGKDALPTSYKSFKNRYTLLKKKLSSSTISK
jgi:hypothetical protein